MQWENFWLGSRSPGFLSNLYLRHLSSIWVGTKDATFILEVNLSTITDALKTSEWSPGLENLPTSSGNTQSQIENKILSQLKLIKDSHKKCNVTLSLRNLKTNIMELEKVQSHKIKKIKDINLKQD